jgi:hypothetical protein
MPHHQHHRCDFCGDDFGSRKKLEEHVERRHPDKDVHWWVVAEDTDELPFSRRVTLLQFRGAIRLAKDW